MQIKNQFDVITIIKILKGALYSMSVPAAIGLLTYIGTLEINNIILASFVSWLVPFMINLIKEYKSGVDKSQY